jgi:hypothetical protein
MSWLPAASMAFVPPRPSPTHALYVSPAEWAAIVGRVRALTGQDLGGYNGGEVVTVLVAVIEETLGIKLPMVVFGVEVVAVPPQPRLQALE